MINVLFLLVTIVTITALGFWINGIKYLNNDEYSKKGIKYVLGATSVIGTCVILGAVLFIPVFFPI